MLNYQRKKRFNPSGFLMFFYSTHRPHKALPSNALESGHSHFPARFHNPVLRDTGLHRFLHIAVEPGCPNKQNLGFTRWSRSKWGTSGSRIVVILSRKNHPSTCRGGWESWPGGDVIPTTPSMSCCDSSHHPKIYGTATHAAGLALTIDKPVAGSGNSTSTCSWHIRAPVM